MQIRENPVADAAIRMTISYPFWSELFYSMTIYTDEDSPECKTAATDGRNMWINREFYAKQTLPQRVTIVLHELCHKIFLHCSRRGDRHPGVWNEAADHAINTMLKANGFQEPGHLKGGWCCGQKYTGWLVDTIYKDLLNNKYG